MSAFGTELILRSIHTAICIGINVSDVVLILLWRSTLLHVITMCLSIYLPEGFLLMSDIIGNDLIRLLVRVSHEFMFSSLLDKQLGLELLVL